MKTCPVCGREFETGEGTGLREEAMLVRLAQWQAHVQEETLRVLAIAYPDAAERAAKQERVLVSG